MPEPGARTLVLKWPFREYAAIRPKGVHCLEGDWWNGLIPPSSIEPTLRQLETIGIKAILPDVGTRSECERYVKMWGQSLHKNYPILSLAFHGSPGVLAAETRIFDKPAGLAKSPNFQMIVRPPKRT
jgi:hypothetical protein